MKPSKYIVTYVGDYPCGHSHKLQIVTHANNALGAIEKAAACLTDESIASTNHDLLSVVPENFSAAHAQLGPNGCKGVKP